jgi:hypothetical protein
MVNQGQFPPDQSPQMQFSPVDPAQSTPQGNGLAVAGLVLGICGLVLCFLPFLGWVLAILGIVFGAVGMNKANKVGRGKGLAIAGLICGAIGLILGVGIFIAALQAAKEIATHNYGSY